MADPDLLQRGRVPPTWQPPPDRVEAAVGEDDAEGGGDEGEDDHGARGELEMEGGHVAVGG